MKKLDLFFIFLIVIGCVLIISGTIVYVSNYIAASALYFSIGGVMILTGLIWLLVKKD